MGTTAQEEFTTRMRKTTREIHNFSDSLIQSKFVIGLIDDRVWAEGLLVFYEIFSYLENSIQRLPDTNVGQFNNPALMRANYFEADLELHYGEDWKVKHPPKDRECVRNYVSHLEELEKTEPDLLIVYIYHLYLGLLSGGRILRKKQKLLAFSKFSKQSSVVDFDSEIVSDLKKFIKDTTNNIAESLNEDQKNQLLKESIMVFKLNCDLIRSVDSAKNVVSKILRSVSYAGIFFMFVLMFYLYSNNRSDDERKEL